MSSEAGLGGKELLLLHWGGGKSLFLISRLWVHWKQKMITQGCLTRHISVSVGFWCTCSSAQSAGAMASRAWDPRGDPSEYVFQMFALGVFPKYPGV